MWTWDGNMIKFRHFTKISSNIFHIICQNLIRQFLKVTFNEIFCKLTLFLFYGTPAYYIASGNSCWLLWPKCWLETEFDYRLRLRFSLLIQLILGKCETHRSAGSATLVVMIGSNCVNLGVQNVPASSNIIIFNYLLIN